MYSLQQKRLARVSYQQKGVTNLNPDLQRLQDLFEQTRVSRHWARIYLKNGNVVEAYADCWTYVTIDEDEDIDAISFVQRDGTRNDISGGEINSLEILESR